MYSMLGSAFLYVFIQSAFLYTFFHASDLSNNSKIELDMIVCTYMVQPLCFTICLTATQDCAESKNVVFPIKPPAEQTNNDNITV